MIHVLRASSQIKKGAQKSAVGFDTNFSLISFSLGLLSFCVACGHGGHTLHLMEWFMKNEICPSGCGCYCLKNGTITSGEDNGSMGFYR